MITIIKKETGADGRSVLRLAGLSTDTKPTGKLNGSEFLEMDTGDKYYYNEDADAGEEWTKPGAVT